MTWVNYLLKHLSVQSFSFQLVLITMELIYLISVIKFLGYISCLGSLELTSPSLLSDPLFKKNSFVAILNIQSDLRGCSHDCKYCLEAKNDSQKTCISKSMVVLSYGFLASSLVTPELEAVLFCLFT